MGMIRKILIEAGVKSLVSTEYFIKYMLSMILLVGFGVNYKVIAVYGGVTLVLLIAYKVIYEDRV
jgi:hypothetical protein